MNLSISEHNNPGNSHNNYKMRKWVYVDTSIFNLICDLTVSWTYLLSIALTVIYECKFKKQHSMGLLVWISTDDPLMTINNYCPMNNLNCRAHSSGKILRSKRVIPCFMATSQVALLSDSLATYAWGQSSGVSKENLKGFPLVLLLGVSPILCSICRRYLGLSKCNLFSRELHCDKHLCNARKLAISPILLFVPQRNCT